MDDSTLNSGKMTPKARRTPTNLGLQQQPDMTDSGIEDRPQIPPQFMSPEGAYDEELKNYPEPLQTELQYLIDARVAKMVHKKMEAHREALFKNMDEES